METLLLSSLLFFFQLEVSPSRLAPIVVTCPCSHHHDRSSVPEVDTIASFVKEIKTEVSKMTEVCWKVLLQPETRLSLNKIVVLRHHATPWQQTYINAEYLNLSIMELLCISGCNFVCINILCVWDLFDFKSGVCDDVSNFFDRVIFSSSAHSLFDLEMFQILVIKKVMTKSKRSDISLCNLYYFLKKWFAVFFRTYPPLKMSVAGMHTWLHQRQITPTLIPTLTPIHNLLATSLSRPNVLRLHMCHHWPIFPRQAFSVRLMLTCRHPLLLFLLSAPAHSMRATPLFWRRQSLQLFGAIAAYLILHCWEKMKMIRWVDWL